MGGVGAAGHDGLQGDDDVGRGDQGVDDGLRGGRVPPAAGDGDREVVLGGHDGSHAGVQLTGRSAGQVVQAVDPLDREAVEQTVGQHGLSTQAGFLGRLEDQVHGAVEPAVAGQHGGCSQHHGHVAVVSACVHRPGDLRGVGHPGVLVDR
jgi:hypothetical protein